MVHDTTLGAVAADARAGVLALVAVARLRADAVGVRHALRLAGLVRVAEVVGSTAADAEAVVLAAFGVGTAATLVARVTLSGRLRSGCEG